MNLNIKNTLYGLIISALLASISQSMSSYLGTTLFGMDKSPISPILVALLLGIILGNKFDFQSSFGLGIQFSMKYVLRIGIILMGIRLGLVEILGYGFKSLFVVFPCIVITIIVTKKIADSFGLRSKIASLIAVGTSICGASAIVAFAPTISAKKNEVVFAIANITVFGIVAMLFYPIIANFLFALDPVSAGIFLGASIHETAQVAGAGMIYSQQYSQPEVMEISTLTKLVRNTAMIFVIPYMAYHNGSKSNSKSIFFQIKSIFPYFILGFIGLGILRTLGDIGINETGLAFNIFDSSRWETYIGHIISISKFCLVMAMSSIGLSTDIRSFKSIGINVFYYGLAVSFLVGMLSLALIYLLIY